METRKIAKVTEIFNIFAYDIVSGKVDYVRVDDVYVNYNANEYYVSVDNLLVPVKKQFISFFYLS